MQKVKSITLLLCLSLLLSGCGKTTPVAVNPNAPKPGTKLLINELPVAERPFVSMIQHSTGKLITFFVKGTAGVNQASVDIEYQSGNQLKGARASLETPIADPYAKAFVLGSCSTGGKCTFDKDLTVGDYKLRLNIDKYPTATHVLKSDFVFVNGETGMPDGKVVFTPGSKKTTGLILSNSLGLPLKQDNEIVLYPILISSADSANVLGKLSITTDATKAMMFDGQAYQPLTVTTKDGKMIITLNQKPWTVATNIVRDDEKGTSETMNLNFVGPIILIK